MNLDTLLEAAIYLEKGKEDERPAKTRERTREFHGYAKSGPPPPEKEAVVTKGYWVSSSGVRWRMSGSVTREVHNKLEKNRRAHLKECFDSLKDQIPTLDDKKTSNLSILRSSLRYIQMLKRKEREFSQEQHRLVQKKVSYQKRLEELKRELTSMNMQVDLELFIESENHSAHSVSTATADNGSPIMSENEDEEPETSAPSTSPEKPARANTVAACLKARAAAGKKPDLAKDVKPEPSTPPRPPIKKTTQNKHAIVTTQPAPGAFLPTSTGVTSVPVHGVKRTHSGTTKSSQSIEMVSLDANHITKPPAAPHATTPITTAATNVTVTGTSASCTLPPYATMTSKSVTMLLAQTLANRAMQQQLANWQKMQQAGGKAPAETSAASTAPSTALPPASSVPPAMAGMKPLDTRLDTIRQALAINSLGLPSAVTPTPALATPVSAPVVSTGVAPTMTNKPQEVATTVPAGTLRMPGSSLPGTVTSAPPVTLSTVKHILASPVTQLSAQLLSPAAQMTSLSNLVAQTVNRSQATTGTTASVSQLLTSTGQLAGVPSVLTPGGQMQAQFLTPVSMVSGSAAGSTPINTATQPQLQTLGQIPLYQSSFGIPQMVKPVVMVTMPSVVQNAASARPATQLTVPLTQVVAAGQLGMPRMSVAVSQTGMTLNRMSVPGTGQVPLLPLPSSHMSISEMLAAPSLNSVSAPTSSGASVTLTSSSQPGKPAPLTHLTVPLTQLAGLQKPDGSAGAAALTPVQAGALTQLSLPLSQLATLGKPDQSATSQNKPLQMHQISVPISQILAAKTAAITPAAVTVTRLDGSSQKAMGVAQLSVPMSQIAAALAAQKPAGPGAPILASPVNSMSPQPARPQLPTAPTTPQKALTLEQITAALAAQRPLHSAFPTATMLNAPQNASLLTTVPGQPAGSKLAPLTLQPMGAQPITIQQNSQTGQLTFTAAGTTQQISLPKGVTVQQLGLAGTALAPQITMTTVTPATSQPITLSAGSQPLNLTVTPSSGQLSLPQTSLTLVQPSSNPSSLPTVNLAQANTSTPAGQAPAPLPQQLTLSQAAVLSQFKLATQPGAPQQLSLQLPNSLQASQPPSLSAPNPPVIALTQPTSAHFITSLSTSQPSQTPLTVTSARLPVATSRSSLLPGPLAPSPGPLHLSTPAHPGTATATLVAAASQVAANQAAAAASANAKSSMDSLITVKPDLASLVANKNDMVRKDVPVLSTSVSDKDDKNTSEPKQETSDVKIEKDNASAPEEIKSETVASASEAKPINRGPKKAQLLLANANGAQVSVPMTHMALPATLISSVSLTNMPESSPSS